MQYKAKTHKVHTVITQMNLHTVNWPSVTNPNPENCKNCSSKCAYDCVELQYTIQHRTSSNNLPSYLQLTIIIIIIIIINLLGRHSTGDQQRLTKVS